MPTQNLINGEFKDHFKKVSQNRFENLPEDIDAIIVEIQDIRGTPKDDEWKEQQEETQSREEIIQQKIREIFCTWSRWSQAKITAEWFKLSKWSNLCLTTVMARGKYH